MYLIIPIIPKSGSSSVLIRMFFLQKNCYSRKFNTIRNQFEKSERMEAFRNKLFLTNENSPGVGLRFLGPLFLTVLSKTCFV